MGIATQEQSVTGRAARSGQLVWPPVRCTAAAARVTLRTASLAPPCAGPHSAAMPDATHAKGLAWEEPAAGAGAEVVQQGWARRKEGGRLSVGSSACKPCMSEPPLLAPQGLPPRGPRPYPKCRRVVPPSASKIQPPPPTHPPHPAGLSPTLTSGAHGGGGCVLLVVQVQDEDDLQRLGQLGVHLIALRGHCGGGQGCAQRGGPSRFCW